MVEGEITIDENGKITIDMSKSGISGKGCIDATKFLEDLGEIDARNKTASYYKQSTATKRTLHNRI